ncbi:MAG TPA: pyruvate dehydrogenase complex dihydrolipoamide acetyltransferase [Alphaproteobacteria bacterium]|nr:pyruvate dehydrogenase complex dihydrolipoamide acetyltransferase [Alphaproteobacteria bacterium]
MPIPILMPALSPTMTEGKLARWLKKEGDAVKPGQVLAEIETDKATMEVEAVDEGKLLKIIVPGGSEGIKVNAPIAVLAGEGEENMTADAALAAIAKKNGAAPLPKKETPPPAADKEALAELRATVSSLMQDKPALPPQAAPSQPQGARVFASPLAKRLAGMVGLDLRGLRGSGPGGRIVKADVEGAKSGGLMQRIVSAVAPAMQGIDARDYAQKLGMLFKTWPNSSVRKVIAKRLTESKQTVPHFYLTIDCEIDALLALRKSVNEVSPAKVSVNDCVIRAVALALKKVPAANASWTDEAILQYENTDISVAVAGPQGLVTPIIKKADTKSLAEIAAEMKDLAARAREGKLRPEEFQGGGFTISNLGMYGIKEFSAIINPPQSCILAVGAGEQRPVVKNGALAVATVMSVTLSVDHRAVDGALGAEFLAAFKPIIENPYSLVV